MQNLNDSPIKKENKEECRRRLEQSLARVNDECHGAEKMLFKKNFTNPLYLMMDGPRRKRKRKRSAWPPVSKGGIAREI